MTSRLDDELVEVEVDDDLDDDELHDVDQVVEHVHVVEPHRVQVHHLYGDRLA